MRKFHIPIAILCFQLFVSCNQTDATKANNSDTINSDTTQSEKKAANNEKAQPSGKIADAATILSRKQVPILCYHQIRDWTVSDSKSAKDYIIPVESFKAHIKLLADGGYHTILPDQLYNYLAYGSALPNKPVMLTFDDTDDDQYNIAAPEMKKYGFKAVFFVMTVSINRPHYMTADQIKQLSDVGHIIGSHTWDHHNVKKYAGDDWITQIDKPTKKIEEITGKHPDYFAYPFGLWNREAIPELKKRGFKSAYILSTQRDPDDPLFTIRRIITSGYWSAATMYKSMINSFD